MTIGIVDTGIDRNSPEFSGRVHAASADVTGAGRTVVPENDHGTNVAMVAAAARNNTGIMGIAWQATVLMARADYAGTCASANGCGFYDADIVRGIDLAINNGAKVINLSLGGSTPGTSLRAAITRAANAGIVVIVAAGNDGTANPDPFAAGLRAAGNGNVIIAGSVNSAGSVSSFSNRAGTGTDRNWYLMALGDRVCCTYVNGQMKITTVNGQQYVSLFSGTSFSAPQIAGAVALLRQAFPNLTAAQTVNLLLTTARDAGAAGTDSIYGRGIMDIGRAFAPQGQTTLATTQGSMPQGSTSLATAQSMGDATQGALLSAIVLDSYQRAYKVELGANIHAADVSPKLARALLTPLEHVAGGNEQVSLAFAVDARGRLQQSPWAGQLRISRADAAVSQVLAARVAARLSENTRFAFGYGQGADGLVAEAQGRGGPAFLIAGAPGDDYGFARGAQTSMAMRHQLGKWSVTGSAERGEALSGALYGSGALRSDVKRDAFTRMGVAFDRSFGDVDASLAASWLAEDRTMLGARLHDGFGARGADSLFFDANAGWNVAPGWRLGAAWRQGFTRARAGGLVVSGSNLISNAWALDVARGDLFTPGDSLALRVSQPLRVASGGLNLDLPVAYSYDTLAATSEVRRLSLDPRGREVSTELIWRGPLWQGAAMASVYYRKDPGHYAARGDDKGVAVSWKRAF